MRKLNFERTVWADRQLAKLCPGNDIKRFSELMSTDDFVTQMDTLMKVIQIMNEGYERKAAFLDPNHPQDVITIEELENLTEEELIELSNLAFENFTKDAEQMVSVEPSKKKESKEESQ